MTRKRLNMDDSYEKVDKESEGETFLDSFDGNESENVETENTTPSKLSNEQKFTVNVDGYLRVRTGPGLEYSIVDQLPNGSVVKVTETDNDWAKIDDGFWVMKQFLK